MLQRKLFSVLGQSRMETPSQLDRASLKRWHVKSDIREGASQVKIGEECSRKKTSKWKDLELGECNWCMLGDSRQPTCPQNGWEGVRWGWRDMQGSVHPRKSHWRASSQGEHSLRYSFRRSCWLPYGNGLEEAMSRSRKCKVKRLLQ